MKTSHTPGPWEVSRIASNEPHFDVYSVGNGGSVAIVRSTKDENAEANARLISQAPRLLEVCEIIAKGYDHRGKLTREYFQEIAKQAIAAAT